MVEQGATKNSAWRFPRNQNVPHHLPPSRLRSPVRSGFPGEPAGALRVEHAGQRVDSARHAHDFLSVAQDLSAFVARKLSTLDEPARRLGEADGMAAGDEDVKV